MTQIEDRSAPALSARMLAVCQRMNETGLNQGTSGNLSVRLDEASLLITPSGQRYETMRAADVARLHFDGHWYGPLRPSTEWRIHRDILLHRPDIGAVLHTHSPHCTALACLREGLPAFHYMVAVAGGSNIRCAPYAIFGSQMLSDLAIRALDGRTACFLANHGLIALAASPEKAFALATEIEMLARMFLLARQAGEPAILSDQEMDDILVLFRTYGTAAFPDDELVQGGLSDDLRN